MSRKLPLRWNGQSGAQSELVDLIAQCLPEIKELLAGPLDVNIASTDVPVLTPQKFTRCDLTTETHWVETCLFTQAPDGSVVKTVLIADADTGIPCSEPIVDSEFTQIDMCIDGTKQVQIYQIDVVDCVTTQTALGDPIETGIECNVKKTTPVKYQKKEYYFGLENTKTRFNRTYVAALTLNNGAVRTVTLPAGTGWLNQMENWTTALTAAFPELCEIANHWWEWRDAFLPNQGTATVPPSDMNFPAAFGQFIQFTACPDQIDFLPVDAQLVSTNGNPTPRAMIYGIDESAVEYLTHCISCDPDCEDEAPKCSIPVGATFPVAPEPNCTFQTSLACDNGTTPATDIVVSYSVCDGVVSAEYFTDDGDGNLDDYTLVGSPVDCTTGEPVVAPEPEVCLTPSGKTKCYGTAAGAGVTEYSNGDNTTDISASSNPTTLKWQIELGNESDADATGLAIAACIAAEGFADITYTYVGGISTSFQATSVLADGTTTGNWAFSGSGPASSSGKLIAATVSCGDGAASGKACSYYDCVNDVTVWKDEITGEIVEPSTLFDCPPEVDCPTKDIQSISCVTADQALPEGTKVLTLQTIDCDNVLLNAQQYVLPAVTLYDGEPLLTEDCDPAPDIETLNECFVDTDGVQWTRVLIFDPLGVDPDIFIFYDSSLTPGTPAGDPKEWTPCPNVSGLVDIEKVCFEYFGSEVKGYAFAYSDGEVQLGTTISPDSAVLVNNAAEYCCDDCIQVFGCRDGRLAWPAGSVVTMSNGDTLDITGLRYSQVAALITATYGGTYSAPSLGGPQGPNFSQCQGSSQHELQFYNVPVQIASIDEMTNYGTFGSCAFDVEAEPTPIKFDSVCANVDGAPQYVQPVNTGGEVSYYDRMGRLITLAVTDADPCDCPCLDCSITACIQMLGFDYDRGLTTVGDTTAFRITDNGTVAATIVHDYTTTYDGSNISTYYDPIIAQINALADWSITLVTDVADGDQGKPNWRIDYSGTGAGELIIEKSGNIGGLGNSDAYIVRVDAAGVLTYAVIDGGSAEMPDFNSPHFSPCA